MESFRRGYLDQWLQKEAAQLIRGKVLDIGGKKKKKRGSFDPDLIATASWEYLNIDPHTEPDIVADATSIPSESDSYDTVILCEVLEHLEFPDAALAEAFRVLKTGGHCIMTTPFMMPVHADPDDFNRPTAEKLQRMLKDHGFTIVSITTMGGLFSVISDLLRFAYVNNKKEFSGMSKVALKTLLPLSRKLQFLDQSSHCAAGIITTGYGVIAVKPSKSAQ